jgi:hypothetical protein
MAVEPKILLPHSATHAAPNMESAWQCQTPSSHGAADPDVLLHEEHNIEADSDVKIKILFNKVVLGNWFDKLSSY